MSNNRIQNTNEVDFLLIWRILGFLFSLIALLSYPLSSSFNLVFGERKTWKILVYIFVILIVPYCILHVKTWNKLPQNFLFRSHLVFVFLIITSVYSYFYDQRVKGKPDRFSLVSSGSFALTFLTLKVQKIQLGLVDDLLKFFLGLLIFQLMKINFLLSFFGAAFCYFPIVLIPFYLDSQSETVGDITTTHQGTLTIKIDTLTYDLRKKLCSILRIENDSENPERFVYPPDFESKLKNEISSGRFVKECYEFFITWQKQVINDKILTDTSLQKLSIKEVPKLPLKYLKDDIKEWKKACDFIIKTLLPQKRHVCNVVFSGLSPLDEQSFMEVFRGLTTQLLSYANAVSTTTQSPERLFIIVDVLETLESLFCDQNCGFLYAEAITVCKRLEEAIRGVFMELENMIHQDPAKQLEVAGGGLHPTNRYVMNFLGAVCRCRNKLERVFEHTQVSLLSSSISSSLSEQMLRIVDLLETNLEANSRIYNNNDSSALCSFFMMNNIRHIIQTAKNSELEDLLGDDWMQKHISKMSQYLVTYKRSSWDRVLELLNIMDSDDESLVQEKLELFKLQFVEVCEIQSSWVILDDRLRNVITSSLRKIMVPAYENFMMEFLKDIEAGDFTVQVIEGLVNNLFLGKDEHTNPRNVKPITWTVVLPSAKDFHEWRKYTEKTIPNSTHPRIYYRCIYKNGHGCGARKHVQQIQENPRMYKTCYSGFHTCRL